MGHIDAEVKIEMKVWIVNPAREGESLVGDFRYVDGGATFTQPFRLPLEEVKGMSVEDVEAYALSVAEPRLAAERVERDWADVLRVIEPMVLKEEKEVAVVAE